MQKKNSIILKDKRIILHVAWKCDMVLLSFQLKSLLPRITRISTDWNLLHKFIRR